MSESFRSLVCCHSRPRVSFGVVAGVLVAALFVFVGKFSAQQPESLHRNPAIEKLAHGQPMVGGQTDDMSLQNCRGMARFDFDYEYVDMEHGPLNLDALAYCITAEHCLMAQKIIS